jgi:23S rRNA pseudouridine1911/1915/1917 synthase
MMNEHGEVLIEVTLEQCDQGARLDKTLAEHLKDHPLALSRTRLQDLIRSNHVTLNGLVIQDIKYGVNAGDHIVVQVPEALPAKPLPEPIALQVIYEDDILIVIDKPAGLVVHPAAGHQDGTLVNALIHHCGSSLSGIGGVKRPGIVHRLDKDTTGLLIVAKTDLAHQHLSAQFADHGRTGSLHRAYTALVWGEMSRAHGTIDAALERDPRSREKISVVPTRAPAERGKYALTHWHLERAFQGVEGITEVSQVTCQLETGRTHQIRVHMAHIGHPLLGDQTYAMGFRTKANRLSDTAQDALNALKRQALHAKELGFAHPLTGEELFFESPLPADIADLILALDASPSL